MRAVALLLLAALAGCISPDAAPDAAPTHADPEPAPTAPGGNATPPPPTPPSPTPPADLPWDGRVLEAVDCGQTFHNAYADRAAVEARVPDHLGVPGSGPVPLIILLLDCRSLALGDADLRRDAWLYLTYVNVDADTPERTRYLLEFGSDWDAAWTPLHERGVAALGAAFERTATAGTDALRLVADGLAYTLRDAGAGPTQVQRGPSQGLLLAGPLGETALDLSVHYAAIDNLPVAGVLELDGGALNELLGPAAPSITTEGRGGATLQPIILPR